MPNESSDKCHASQIHKAPVYIAFSLKSAVGMLLHMLLPHP